MLPRVTRRRSLLIVAVAALCGGVLAGVAIACVWKFLVALVAAVAR